MSTTDFASLSLRPDLLQNLSDMGYDAMTPIQAGSLPLVLDGKDVIAQAKTGSGKTAAFGLGILHKLDVKRFRVQSLVLCPTRELADQVAKELRKLARAIHNIKILSLCGGLPIGPQIGSLEHGAHIIVGTPGRVEEHLRKNTLNLDNLTMLVLDEADRMLDMGFQDSLDAILEYTPDARQTLLFSATYPDEIKAIAERVMQNPEQIKVESTHDNQSIHQTFYRVENDAQRLDAVRLLLMKHRPESSIVFCNTKIETQEVADELSRMGFTAIALNGDMEQRARDETLVKFANKSASVLVATDVAARGLDIEALDAVFNFHIARDLDVHTHRVGRTGRAGSKGVAFTFYSDKEQYKLEMLEDRLGYALKKANLPAGNQRNQTTFKPPMVTLQIDGGKKQKVRPGDILGALTGEEGIAGKLVGKIQIFDQYAYVAVQRDAVKPALAKLTAGKLKGRSFRVRKI